MGWISKRHMQTGGSIGGKQRGKTYPKKGAPLRRIVAVLVPSTSLFEANWVALECGHEASSWGGVRARCPKCKSRESELP
jgi:hypothetical protein